GDLRVLHSFPTRRSSDLIQASYEQVDLPKLTAEIASNFHTACELAGLTLVIDCRPVSHPVYVDREMWEKIVLNLLSNAFKFTLQDRKSTRLNSSHSQISY